MSAFLQSSFTGQPRRMKTSRNRNRNVNPRKRFGRQVTGVQNQQFAGIGPGDEPSEDHAVVGHNRAKLPAERATRVESSVEFTTRPHPCNPTAPRVVGATVTLARKRDNEIADEFDRKVARIVGQLPLRRRPPNAVEPPLAHARDDGWIEHRFIPSETWSGPNRRTEYDLARVTRGCPSVQDKTWCRLYE